MDEEKIEHDVLLHLYTFGPKHGNNQEERTKAHNDVRESVLENYGSKSLNIVGLREVRDISTTHLQYCVDISLKSEVIPAKKRKVE